MVTIIIKQWLYGTIMFRCVPHQRLCSHPILICVYTVHHETQAKYAFGQQFKKRIFICVNATSKDFLSLLLLTEGFNIIVNSVLVQGVAEGDNCHCQVLTNMSIFLNVKCQFRTPIQKDTKRCHYFQIQNFRRNGLKQCYTPL